MYLSKVSIKVSSSYFNNNLIMEILYSAFIHPCVSESEWDEFEGKIFSK